MRWRRVAPGLSGPKNWMLAKGTLTRMAGTNLSQKKENKKQTGKKEKVYYKIHR